MASLTPQETANRLEESRNAIATGQLPKEKNATHPERKSTPGRTPRRGQALKAFDRLQEVISQTDLQELASHLMQACKEISNISTDKKIASHIEDAIKLVEQMPASKARSSGSKSSEPSLLPTIDMNDAELDSARNQIITMPKSTRELVRDAQHWLLAHKFERKHKDEQQIVHSAQCLYEAICETRAEWEDEASAWKTPAWNKHLVAAYLQLRQGAHPAEVVDLLDTCREVNAQISKGEYAKKLLVATDMSEIDQLHNQLLLMQPDMQQCLTEAVAAIAPSNKQQHSLKSCLLFYDNLYRVVDEAIAQYGHTTAPAWCAPIAAAIDLFTISRKAVGQEFALYAHHENMAASHLIREAIQISDNMATGQHHQSPTTDLSKKYPWIVDSTARKEQQMILQNWVADWDRYRDWFNQK